MKHWAYAVQAHQGRRLVALLSVLVLLLTACAPVAPSGQGAGTAADSATTLKLMCWSGAIAAQELVVNDLIPNFQKQNPNIIIQYEEMPWPEYWTKIAALAASGAMPDIYCNSVAYLWDHANKNMSANIQSLFDRDLKGDDYFMELTAVERYPDAKGDLYGFPFRWVDGALFYNKKLFDEAGVEYPNENWSYEDVLAAAQKLTKDTDNDGEPDQWGLLASMNHIMLDSIIKSNGGQVLDDSYSKCMLTEEKALAGIQWIADLVLTHKISPSPTVVQGFAQGIFPSGKVAMQIDGSYMTVPFKDIKDFEWDVNWQPQGAEGRVVYGGPDSLSISKNTPHLEEAWAFMKYMVSPEVQGRGDLIGLGSLPILKNAAASDSWVKAAGQPANAKIFADSGPFVEGADFGSQWIEWRATIMNSELEQALLGTRSVEESAAAACKAIDEVLVKIEKPQ
jgi:multiple sugar transport system substrate-binding protein